MRHAFIVGCARTGSNVHRDVLNAHSQVHLIGELHYLAPRWIRRDARFHARRAGLLDRPDPQGWIDLLYAGVLDGVFWELEDDGTTDRIISYDRPRIEAAIRASDCTMRGVMDAVMRVAAEDHGATVAGSKNPVDIGFTTTLLDWYPDAHLVHTVRDPRAIYSSMAAADLRLAKRRGRLAEARTRSTRLAYIVSRYWRAFEIHQQLRDHPRYVLSRYEDLVQQPEEHVRGLCDGLELPFEPAMLEPRVRNTSYQAHASKEGSGRTGFESQRVDRWRERIAPRTAAGLARALQEPMISWGYL